MINGIKIVSVWVLDQDSAKKFYTGKLGFTLTTDLTLDNGMRWMTVRPPGNPDQEFLLTDPSRPYGIEAILRDDSGNWFSFTQRTY